MLVWAGDAARTLALSMEKDDGKISASDFGRFVAECLPRSPFTAAALLTVAKHLQPKRSPGAQPQPAVHSGGF